MSGGLRTACHFARRRLAAEAQVEAAEEDDHPHGQDEPGIKRRRRHVIINLFVKPRRAQRILRCSHSRSGAIHEAEIRREHAGGFTMLSGVQKIGRLRRDLRRRIFIRHRREASTISGTSTE